MSATTPQASSRDVLQLVVTALNEFDSVPLESTVRRTVRIASLLGDTLAAIRLGLEVKPSGGHPPANAEMTRRLMADPTDWGADGGLADQAIETYMAERRNEDGLVLSHSLSEIDFWQREQGDLGEMSAALYASNLAMRAQMVTVLERARHHAFTLLCQWERELTFAATQDDALSAVRTRVETRLPADVLDMFNAAFRRMRDAVSRDSATEATEELTQALTSCRRIMKATVDHVQPADAARPKSDNGHALTDEQYKNRLVEFLKANVESSSFRAALVKDGESLFERFSSIDSLASKAVHAQVALEEAEFCALHTYLLAGEVLALAEPSSSNVPGADQ
jgi:hypothetical protein